MGDGGRGDGTQEQDLETFTNQAAGQVGLKHIADHSEVLADKDFVALLRVRVQATGCGPFQAQVALGSIGHSLALPSIPSVPNSLVSKERHVYT